LRGFGGDPVAQRRALGELLLERYGIVTREQVLAEGIVGGFSAIYSELGQLETLGVARRGYFLEGLGGAQFALPGAVERLRARPASSAEAAAPLVLAAVDPAQPYGAALPWPKRDDERRRPARAAGAYVVLVGGDPVLYLERGGKALQTLVEADDGRLEPALSALVNHVRSGAIKRLALEKVDGESAMTSPLAPALTALGFQEGPRRLTLTA
jgi:ATP-dependent Lhr-like helicase